MGTTGTAGTYGPSANVTGTNGTTIKVPQITTDAYGRVTSVTERTYTSKDTTYSAATTSANGLMTSAMVTKLNGIATGATKITVDTAMSSTSTNPVQNKIVYAAIDAAKSEILESLLGGEW